MKRKLCGVGKGQEWALIRGWMDLTRDFDALEIHVFRTEREAN
jgi:hypothetical protein